MPKDLYLPTAENDMVWFVAGDLRVLLVWLAALNLVTFLVFGLDKWKAKGNRRRIPEKTLFLLSFLGGSIGALAGMKVWRHKTLHKSFRFGIPAILAVQVLLGLVWKFFL